MILTAAYEKLQEDMAALRKELDNREVLLSILYLSQKLLEERYKQNATLQKEVDKLKDVVKQQTFNRELLEKRNDVLQEENKLHAADIAQRGLENSRLKEERHTLAA